LTVTGTVATEPGTLMAVQVYRGPGGAAVAVAGITAAIAASTTPAPVIRSMRRNILAPMMPPSSLYAVEKASGAT
jgi:hypothetical protein